MRARLNHDLANPSYGTLHPSDEVRNRSWCCLEGRHHAPRHLYRRGFSLLEVIVSIAILFGGVIALSQLASIGHQHAQRSARITTAQTLCQNKLNEVVAGVVPLMPVVDAPFHESPDWIYTINIEPMWNELVSVKVSVYQTSELTLPADAIRDVALPRKPHYSLVRWLRPIQNETIESLDESTFPHDDSMAGPTP